MKKYITAALLAAGVLTCSNCFAALEYSFDREAKIFTAKSEDIISLNEGANMLRVSFTKEYNLGPNKKGKVAAIAKPVYHVRMYVEGTNEYKFADNANYWQEHNYTYAQMTTLKEIEAEKRAIDKRHEKEKLSAEEAKAANGGKPVQLTAEEQAAKDQAKLAEQLRLQKLNEQEATIKKPYLELNRNPSTLIYLNVENKISSPKLSKPLYDFAPTNEELDAEKQRLAENSVPDAALTTKAPTNLMDEELRKSQAEKQRLEYEKERETLAKLEADKDPRAEELRKKVVERETAEKEIAKADANEKEINAKVATNAKTIELVKATRAAFMKYQEEQKQAMQGLVYTSTAEAKIPAGDNFFRKIKDSRERNIPMFFEVKFWNGGANERMWLKTDKLKEMEELLAYDLYKDEANLKLIKTK